MESRVQRLREWLALLLMGLLPFHAFLVTVGTRLLLGPGHAPSTMLALWKEGMMLFLIMLSMGEVVSRRARCRVDSIDALILALLFLAVIVSSLAGTSAGLFALGVKYDFLPLLILFVCRRVAWSAAFRQRLLQLLLWVGGAVALVGLVSFFLPVRAFVALGYADLHSLYLPNQPLAPFQQIGESWVRRVQSTMSGPNQLGIWMLLPLSTLLAFVWQGRERSKEQRMKIFPTLVVVGALLCAALVLTFSRAAWLAAVFMGVVVLFGTLPRQTFRRLLLVGGSLAVALVVVITVLFPSIFFRLSSSRGHLVNPLQAIAKMSAHPLGLGLGSAGPASNRISEPCIFLRPQDDPSWAKSQPQLCVFLGTTQVQPHDHACGCPFLPENWYLQIGVEMGVLGFVLFVALIVTVLRRLWKQTDHWSAAAFLFFFGVSIAALFLHAWEDAAVAYTGWLLAAIALSREQSSQ